ncbi:MAG: transposase, partial [Deltaproteobacteria bacterium]|nr:transposase [Deltaproteobacteria bacterium]
LKVVGDGEWHAHRHRTSNKRRSWRKLHLGVDSDGFIVASALTDSGVDDSSVGVTMVKENEASIGRFTADGAYDTTASYEALATVGLP